MILNENSLYTNQQERDDFVKDKQKVIDSLLFNYFGFLSLYSLSSNVREMKRYVNDEGKVTLGNIEDTNFDVSLSVKLAVDAGVITKPQSAPLTKLLFKMKSRQVNGGDIDDDKVRELITLTKLTTTNKPSPMLRAVLNEFMDGTIHIGFLAYGLYKLSKKFENVCTEFRLFYKKGGYSVTYADYKAGRIKAAKGVPQHLITNHTAKTVVHTATTPATPTVPVVASTVDGSGGVSQAATTKVLPKPTPQVDPVITIANVNAIDKAYLDKYFDYTNGKFKDEVVKDVASMSTQKAMGRMYETLTLIPATSTEYGKNETLTNKIISNMEKQFGKSLFNDSGFMAAYYIRNCTIQNQTNSALDTYYYKPINTDARNVLSMGQMAARQYIYYLLSNEQDYNKFSFSKPTERGLFQCIAYCLGLIVDELYISYVGKGSEIPLDKVVRLYRDLPRTQSDRMSRICEAFTLLIFTFGQSITKNFLETLVTVDAIKSYDIDGDKIYIKSDTPNFISQLAVVARDYTDYEISELVVDSTSPAHLYEWLTDNNLYRSFLNSNSYNNAYRVTDDALSKYTNEFKAPTDAALKYLGTKMIEGDTIYYTCYFRYVYHNIENTLDNSLEIQKILYPIVENHQKRKLFYTEYAIGKSTGYSHILDTSECIPLYLYRIYNDINTYDELKALVKDVLDGLQSGLESIITSVNTSKYEYFIKRNENAVMFNTCIVNIYNNLLTAYSDDISVYELINENTVMQYIKYADESGDADLIAAVKALVSTLSKFKVFIYNYPTLLVMNKPLFDAVNAEAQKDEYNKMRFDGEYVQEFIKGLWSGTNISSQVLEAYSRPEVIKLLTDKLNDNIARGLDSGETVRAYEQLITGGGLNKYPEIQKMLANYFADHKFNTKITTFADVNSRRWGSQSGILQNFMTTLLTVDEDRRSKLVDNVDLSKFEFPPAFVSQYGNGLTIDKLFPDDPAVYDQLDEKTIGFLIKFAGKMMSAKSRIKDTRNKIAEATPVFESLLSVLLEIADSKNYKIDATGIDLTALRKNIVASSLIPVIYDTVKNDIIKPEGDFNQSTLSKALQWNKVNLGSASTGLPRIKKTDDVKTVISQAKSLLGQSINVVLPALPVTEVAVTEAERAKKSYEYYKSYSNGKHGDIAAIIKREFDVSLPGQADLFNAFVAENPDTKYLEPAFHSCGTLAASFILRYGFADIKDSSIVTGKMLGPGLYVTNVLDKSLLYASDRGYVRQPGQKGYVIELKCALGKSGKDYRYAGPDNSNVLSPEWCLKSPRSQGLFVKVYYVETVNTSTIRRIGQSVT